MNGEEFVSTPYHVSKENMGFTAIKVPNEFLLKNEKDKEVREILMNNEVIIYEFSDNHNSDVLKTQSTLPYDKSVQHFSQNIASDFIAITSKGEKIICAGVVHERTFGVRPRQRLLLHFNKKTNSPIVTINYTDRLFNRGLITHQLKDQPIEL